MIQRQLPDGSLAGWDDWKKGISPETSEDDGQLRTYPSGATRDTAEGKLEPWGFTSALVTKRYSEYMHVKRIQSDGKLRASDNWKKGISPDDYAHSLSRHVEDLKLILEGFPEEATEVDITTVLCAIRFNVDGLLFEALKARNQR